MLTLASAIRRLSLLRRQVVFEAKVSQLAAASSCAVFSRLVREDEIAEALDLSLETDDERRLMSERLARGHWCIGGRVDGALAFYAWLMFGEMEIGARIAAIPEAYAYSYKVFTARPFRRRGIAASYYAFLGRELTTFERVLATVAAENQASRALHERSGFSSIGAVWLVRGTDRTLTTDGVARLIMPHA